MKKTVSAILACDLVLGAVLCGCGKDESKAGSSTPSEVPYQVTTVNNDLGSAAVSETAGASDSGETEARGSERKTEQGAEQTSADSGKPEAVSDEQRIVSDCAGARSFSGVVYAEKDGSEIYSGGDLNSVYHVASVSKQFTAAAVMLLYEEGKLDIYSPVGNFIPGMTCGNVTIHQLLDMSSGIPDYLTEAIAGVDIGVSPQQSADQNREAVLKWIKAQNAMFSPGSEFYYCNSNYFLLAEIITRVSGMPYEQFITKRFLEPLNMTSTGFSASWSGNGNVISSENSDDPFNCKGLCSGAADMLSTAKDLAKWGRELYEHKILSGNSVSLMTTGYIGGYGYGLIVGDYTNVFYHDGNLPPYCSTLCVSPERKFVLVLLDCSYDGTVFALRDSICGEISG